MIRLVLIGLFMLFVVAVLWSLGVVLCAERVKRELRERICDPVRVKWRPFGSTDLSCSFDVTYLDFRGRLHRARCRTRWIGAEIEWQNDRVMERPVPP